MCSSDLIAAVAAGMIVGGAIGNLIDRLFRNDAWLRGAVVDFIDLQWFPVFNIADSCITFGAILMVLVSMRSGKLAAAAKSGDVSV